MSYDTQIHEFALFFALIYLLLSLAVEAGGLEPVYGFLAQFGDGLKLKGGKIL